MRLKFNRQARHIGKHGSQDRATLGELLADALPSAQAGTPSLCSESTVAWLRSERQIALDSADDNHNQAMQLLELEKIERARAADLGRLLVSFDAGPIASTARTYQPAGAEPQPATSAEAERERWQSQSEAPTVQLPQVDLPGVLAAAKHDAQRVAAVASTPPWPQHDEDAPLYGQRWTPQADEAAYISSLTNVGGVA